MLDKIHIRVQSPHMERTLGKLQQAGLPLYHIQKNDDAFESIVSPRTLRAMRHVLQGEHCHVRILKKEGQLRLRKKAAQRAGMAMGLVGCLMALVMLSQMLWQITLLPGSGQEEAFAEFLQRNNVRIGAFFMQYDLDALEEKLAEAFPQMSFVAVRKKGVTMEFEMIPFVQGEPIFDADTPCHVVAAADGVIRQVITLSGRALVQPGDAVTEGQVLIEGWQETADGGLRPVHAQGFVQAERVFAAEAYAPIAAEQRQPTGNVKVKNHFRLFGLKLGYEKDEPFVHYNRSTEEIPLFGRWGLPLYLVRETFFQQQVQTVARDRQAVMDEATRNALQEILQNLPKDAVLVDKWVEFSNMENIEVKVSLALTVLTELGQERIFTPIHTGEKENH